ncbi:TPA: hypothetical protein ACU8B2_002128 [Neisseria subflava]
MMDSSKMLILAIFPLTLFAYIWAIDKAREMGRFVEVIVLGIFGIVLAFIFMLLAIGQFGVE